MTEIYLVSSRGTPLRVVFVDPNQASNYVNVLPIQPEERCDDNTFHSLNCYDPLQAPIDCFPNEPNNNNSFPDLSDETDLYLEVEKALTPEVEQKVELELSKSPPSELVIPTVSGEDLDWPIEDCSNAEYDASYYQELDMMEQFLSSPEPTEASMASPLAEANCLELQQFENKFDSSVDQLPAIAASTAATVTNVAVFTPIYTEEVVASGTCTARSRNDSSCSSSGEELPKYLRQVKDPSRKKSQNKKAAFKYRNKKRSEIQNLDQTIEDLLILKKDIADRVSRKNLELSTLEGLVREIESVRQ